MYSFDVNEASANLDEVLIKVKSEPVEIKKNGTAVAFVLSTAEHEHMETLKMELVKSRFKNIAEAELQDGDTFLDELDS